MSSKLVFSLLFILAVITLLVFYWFIPISDTNFLLQSQQSNPNIKNTATPIQFYENMRFPSSRISYKIEDCPLQKKDDTPVDLVENPAGQGSRFPRVHLTSPIGSLTAGTRKTVQSPRAIKRSAATPSATSFWDRSSAISWQVPRRCCNNCSQSFLPPQTKRPLVRSRFFPICVAVRPGWAPTWTPIPFPFQPWCR